jgi:hypothetical protein
VKKMMFFLGSDNYGAYWAIRQGSGAMAYEIANLLSLLFWLFLAAMCVRALLHFRREDRVEEILPLIYPFIYGLVVFAVFESGSRQHIFAVGPLIALASAYLSRSRVRSSCWMPSLERLV